MFPTSLKESQIRRPCQCLPKNFQICLFWSCSGHPKKALLGWRYSMCEHIEQEHSEGNGYLWTAAFSFSAPELFALPYRR